MYPYSSEEEAPSSPAQQQQLDHENSGTELTRSDSQTSSSSSEEAGAYSKKAMVKLMREQVDLVRNLTNAQIAQKKELEEVKAEKRRLEEEREKERQLAADSAKKNNNSTTITRLNLPTRSTSPDNRDSDNQSISTFSRYFNRTTSNIKSQRTTKYRHPDEAYYRRDRDNRARAFSDEQVTVANCDPSVASTIGMPSAIIIDPAKANTTGAFGYNSHIIHNHHQQPYRVESPYKDRITITPIPERNVIPKEELNKNGCLSSLWWFFSHFCTLFVPNFFLCCVGRNIKSRREKNEAKQAWREKVAIFVIMLLCSAAFIGVSGVVPMFLCRETEVFTMVSKVANRIV